MATPITTTIAPTDAAPPHPPTDEQILTQLATLQSLHSSLFQLRSLLPERLIDPVKAAVEASRSGYEPPAALAAHLRSVAVDGDRDVKAFKERWRSEEMTGVWHASKGREYPQGSDVWGLEYGEVVGDDGEARDGGLEVELEVEEDIKGVFEKFSVENPKVKLERRDAEGRAVADLVVAGQSFTITQADRVEGMQRRSWLITAKAGGLATSRSGQILQSLQSRPRRANLSFLLVITYSILRLQDRLTSTGHDRFIPRPEDTTLREMQKRIRRRCQLPKFQDFESKSRRTR